jgi:hypothetical protein
MLLQQTLLPDEVRAERRRRRRKRKRRRSSSSSSSSSSNSNESKGGTGTGDGRNGGGTDSNGSTAAAHVDGAAAVHDDDGNDNGNYVNGNYVNVDRPPSRQEGGVGSRCASSNGRRGASEGDGGDGGGGGGEVRVVPAEPRPSTHSLRQWEGEMELAAHCQRVQDRIGACHQRIEEYQRKIKECAAEATRWEEELEELMVLPRLDRAEDQRAEHEEAERSLPPYPTRRNDGRGVVLQQRTTPPYDDTDDERNLPCRLRGDKNLAWALLQADPPLPVPFQRALFTDPHCPLRNDRAVLRASVEKGLDTTHVTIAWSHGMANDRQRAGAKVLRDVPSVLESLGRRE